MSKIFSHSHNSAKRRWGQGLLPVGQAACLTALCLALAACGSADNAAGPGGVTVGEARSLDEAAQMVESQQTKTPVPLPSNADQSLGPISGAPLPPSDGAKGNAN